MSISPILRMVCIWRFETAIEGRMRRKTSTARPTEAMGTARLFWRALRSEINSSTHVSWRRGLAQLNMAMVTAK